MKVSKHFLLADEYILDKIEGNVLSKKVNILVHAHRRANNEHQKNDPLLDKQLFLDEAAEPERRVREEDIQVAKRIGRNLSLDEIQKYRKKEELERFIAYKFLKKSPYYR